LGGLFRNRLLAEVLDRSLHVPAEAELIVVVEGWTDRRFIEIALERSGRGDLLKRLAIVEAGLSLPAEQAGGSALAVAQALITRATSTLPVVALLDNDEPGRKAAHDLRAIGDKTGDWKKNQTVFTYACMFKGDAQFGYEAEDLWPNA
jgi:hypothetical protein